MKKIILLKKKVTTQINRPPSARLRKVVAHLVENGGTMSDAIRHAGYSEAIAHTPSKLTRSQAYIRLMDKVGSGLRDEDLQQKHNELLHASHLDEYIFEKTGVGKGRRHVTDEEIKKIIESQSGLKLIRIANFGSHKKAFFSAPDHTNRKNAIDMAYKIKGLFAPEKFESEETVKHELSASELDEVLTVLKSHEEKAD